jgi:2-polyprenyl-3-methyl-5-hydroxy-6-metoxy-1,4-benzoquinol methylase
MSKTKAQQNLLLSLFLDAEYPDKIISFAERYTHWRRIHSIIECVLRRAKKFKKESLQILDIGCGFGYIDFKLKQKLESKIKISITGVDTYEPAIDFAKKRKKHINVDDCDFEVMDGCDLRFKNDSFDIVICSEVIEHLIEPGRLMEEIYRVLKKGGMAIITTPNKGKGLIYNTLKNIKNMLFDHEKKELSENPNDRRAYSVCLSCIMYP